MGANAIPLGRARRPFSRLVVAAQLVILAMSAGWAVADAATAAAAEPTNAGPAPDQFPLLT